MLQYPNVNIKLPTLLDCVTCGIPWPESRKNMFKAAPEQCKTAISQSGSFFLLEPFSEVEREALKNVMPVDSVFSELDDYIFHPRSSVRAEDARVLWYVGTNSTDTSMHFSWADMREHKIKILFNRQFWSAFHRIDDTFDQLSEIYKYYNRVLHTFRRMKFIRWIKITLRDGRARIYIYNERAVYPEKNVQLVLERSFHRDESPAFCDLLDGDYWTKAWPHVRDRIDFWRREETGALDDEYLETAVRSEDEILVSWAVANLNRASDPFMIELLKKHVQSNSVDEANAAVRTAGRLWLQDLEQDVMRQYNRRGNAMGPAVADFIGSMNFFDGEIIEKKIDGAVLKLFGSLIVNYRGKTEFNKSDKIIFGIRPEQLKISLLEPKDFENGISGTIENQIYMGEATKFI
ncbi:MAG TPA: TOBE domain-containing protein, partial [bacterium]|nr:TOBE domain-containing protein [bacterium]